MQELVSQSPNWYEETMAHVLPEEQLLQKWTSELEELRANPETTTMPVDAASSCAAIVSAHCPIQFTMQS